MSSVFFHISTDLEKTKDKVFNWSEVHFYWSNFLQNLKQNFSHEAKTFKVTEFRQKDDKIVDSISIVKKLEWGREQKIFFKFFTGKFKDGF